MKEFVLLLLVAALATPVMAKDKNMTSAPPEVQEEIHSFLSMMGRSRYQCTKKAKIKVLSVEISEDAEFDEAKNMTKGSVREIWQARHCRTKAKYAFRIGPDESGTIKLLGFEAGG